MKKLALSILSLIFLSGAIVGLVICNKNHTHSFTEQKVEQQYLASEATCTEAAKYYYSCACGEKGSSTFESGNALGHDFGEWTIVDSKKTRKCMRNGCEYSETEEILQEGSKGLSYSVNSDNVTCTVTGIGTCTDKDIVIPGKTADGYKVTSIGKYVFQNCSGLESISVLSGNTKYHSNGNCLIETETKTLISGCKNSIIPSDGSVTSIGEYAFFGCDSLTSVTIPDSVTSIGGYAFAICSSLTSVTIPDSVTYIGDVAFCDCSSLTSVTIPDSVTSIGEYTFNGCSNLTSVTIGNSVTSIGGSAFADCSSLTSVTIPDSVTSIVSFAFRGCSGLEIISVSSGNTKYHSNGNCLIETETKTLISGCKNSIIPSDGSVTSIGDSAFYGYSELTSVTIPDSVTSIGNRAFYGCSSLTGVTIPDSVTSIGDQAFFGCDSLTSVTIPDSVTSIGEWAFYGCSGLTSVTIPNSVTSIEDYAFRGCSSLTSVTIGNSVTSIGEQAFYGCSGLTTINYNGTIAQWKGIPKARLWDLSTGNYTVYCTDGTISKQ